MLKGLLGEPAIELNAPFPALDCCGGKALPSSPCQVSTSEVSLIPVLEGRHNGIQRSFSDSC